MNFRRLFRWPRNNAAGGAGAFGSGFFSPWMPEGVEVSYASDPAAAMSLPAVRRAVTAVAQDIARLPVKAYRIGAEDLDELPRGDIWDVLNERFNEFTTATEAKRYLVTQCMLWGNSFAVISRRGAELDSLIPLNPWDVQLNMRDDGTPVYNTSEYGEVAPSDILHFRMPATRRQLWGASPIADVEQSLRLMSLLETAGIEQYRQPGMGKIALQISEAVGGSGVRAIQESFRAVHSGREGMTRPIVVQNGATVQQVGRSLVDQDWVNGRTQAIEDIARAFGVPPFVLFTGSDGMGAEESRLYGESLQGYTDSFGAEIAAKLYPEESVSVRFDVTRIMRGTFTESMSAYKEAVQLGVMTPNEVRKEMGLPPIEGGDEMYVGPNMETTKESSDDDSEDEPGPDPSEDGGAGDDLGED